MSAENVEALKRAIDAHNRGDYAAFLEAFAPEIEWHAVFNVKFGERKVSRGHESMRQYLDDLDQTFVGRRIEISEYRDLGDRVVGIGTAGGRGRESEMVIDSPYAFVADFQNGKVIRLSDYFDVGEALEAAGADGES